MIDQQAQEVRIGNGQWHFVNGDWHDFDEGALGVAKDDVRRDGDSIQGHHYAFARHLCFQDVRVRFDFRVGGHADAGIVLRATDESDFYLLHFPGCAQSSRGQHFFAALSRMDHSGYLRCIKLEMVRRVPSHPVEWMTAELVLQRGRVSVNIGDHGFFEAEDGDLFGPGCVGLHMSTYFAEDNAVLRNVVVQGEPAARVWNDHVSQPTNWFKPLPSDDPVWQMPQDMIDLPDGQLLLTYNAQTVADASDEAKARLFLTRSQDRGRSWSDPVQLRMVETPSAWEPPRLHLTPAGRLIALLRQDDNFFIAESTDAAKTWADPTPVNVPGTVKDGKLRFQVGPQAFVNLADGAMVLFGYGILQVEGSKDLHTWGGQHFQAFSCRSTDDGLTWSTPVNVDNRGLDKDGNQIDGNMDLTEVCAAQMGNGNIMGLIRPIYSPWMWETWSKDGGVTWGPCVRGPFPGYATSNMLRTKSGAVLVAHRQPNMTINCSRDDGHTWDQGTIIDGGLWCMGEMREIEPDVVLYVYWDTFESHMRAQLIRVLSDRLEPVRIG